MKKTIRIDEEEWKDIKMLSIEFNMTLTEVIRVLISNMEKNDE